MCVYGCTEKAVQLHVQSPLPFLCSQIHDNLREYLLSDHSRPDWETQVLMIHWRSSNITESLSELFSRLVTKLSFYCYYTWHHYCLYHLLASNSQFSSYFSPSFSPFLSFISYLFSPVSSCTCKMYLCTNNRWCQLMLSFPRKHCMETTLDWLSITRDQLSFVANFIAVNTNMVWIN